MTMEPKSYIVTVTCVVSLVDVAMNFELKSLSSAAQRTYFASMPHPFSTTWTPCTTNE